MSFSPYSASKLFFQFLQFFNTPGLHVGVVPGAGAVGPGAGAVVPGAMAVDVVVVVVAAVVVVVSAAVVVVDSVLVTDLVMVDSVVMGAGFGCAPALADTSDVDGPPALGELLTKQRKNLSVFHVEVASCHNEGVFLLTWGTLVLDLPLIQSPPALRPAPPLPPPAPGRRHVLASNACAKPDDCASLSSALV